MFQAFPGDILLMEEKILGFLVNIPHPEENNSPIIYMFLDY